MEFLYFDFMELTPLETLQGILTLIFVVVSLILGLSIMSKYTKQKNKLFLLVGTTWICLVSPYWPDAISIITILLFNFQLEESLYFFLAMAFIPLVHITWIWALTNLIFKKKGKYLLIFFSVETLIYELLFLYLLFTDVSLIGTRVAPFDVDWSYFVILYLMFSIIAFTITGLLFAQESLRAKDKEVKLKGYFLLIAFISFAVGTFFEAIAVMNPAILVIIRIIVLSAAFEFYIGFTMPNIIKNIFLKDR